jgi:transposase InsO family protein
MTTTTHSHKAWTNKGGHVKGISCRRVLSDNGSAYRSKPWREACSALGLTPKRTRPYTPRTNGKAERFIKTLLAEWAYSMAFQSSTERNRWLPRYLAIYNARRCHMAPGWPHPHSATPTVAGY